MRKFVEGLFRNSPDLSILTHAIVRREYLVHCSKERLSKEEKQQLKKLVEEQLLRMQVSDSSDDEPLIKKIESLAGKKKGSDLKKRSRSNSSRDSDERQDSPSKQNSKKKRVKSDQSTDEDSGIERKVPIKRRNAKKARKSRSSSESSDLEASRVEAGSDHEDLAKHDGHNSENKKSALKSGLTDGKRRMDSENASSESEAEARRDKISDVDASDVSSDEHCAVDSKKAVNHESEESDSSAPLKENFKGGSKSEQKTKAELNSDSEQSRDSDSEVVQKSIRNARKAPKQKSITTKQEKEDSGDGSELVSSSEDDEPASKGTGQDRGKERESSSDEDLLPSAGGKQKQTSKKAKKSSPSNEQESAKEEHPTIKRLKRYIVACGVRRNYKKLFEGCRSNKAKIQALKQELENLGMKGQPSLEKCKALRLKREEAAELASLDVSNIITSGRPRRLNPWTANQKSEEVPPKENYRKAVDSDSDDEPPAKKRLTAWANLKGIISDDEGSE